MNKQIASEGSVSQLNNGVASPGQIKGSNDFASSVTGALVLVFFIQAEPYIGITPGCAASESGVTPPELLIMFPYGYLERF